MMSKDSDLSIISDTAQHGDSETVTPITPSLEGQAGASSDDIKIEICPSSAGRPSVSQISHSTGAIVRPTSASESVLYHTNNSSKYLSETVWGVRQVQPTSEGELPIVTTMGPKEEQQNLHNKLDNIRQVSMRDLNYIFEEEEDKNDIAESEEKESTEYLLSQTPCANLKPTHGSRLTMTIQRSLSSLVNKCVCGSNKKNASAPED